MGEDEEKDLESQRLVREILDLEQPDFVAVTGDIVSSFVWNGEENWFAGQYDKFFSILDDMGFWFATTAGNHDSEADLTREQVSELDRSYKMSLTKPNAADISHVFNYMLPVYDEIGE